MKLSSLVGLRQRLPRSKTCGFRSAGWLGKLWKRQSDWIEFALWCNDGPRLYSCNHSGNNIIVQDREIAIDGFQIVVTLSADAQSGIDCFVGFLESGCYL